MAEIAVNYKTNTTKTSTLSPTIQTYYDKQLLANAKPNLVHNQFGQKRPIPKGSGKTINFRRFSKLAKATQALSEGVTPDGNSMTITEIDATVQQFGAYITTSDLLELSAIDPVVAENNKILSQNAAETLDHITAQILAAGTNVLFAGGGGDRDELTVADNTLKVSDVKRAAAILKNNNASKINGAYVAIVHPFVGFDLMSDSEWIDVKNYDNKDLYAGEIGTLYGIRFVESSEATVFKAAGAPATSGGDDKMDVFATLVIGADAYGVTEISGGGLKMIVKQLGSGGSTDPLDQRGTQGWKATHTAKILNQLNMVRIESAATMTL